MTIKELAADVALGYQYNRLVFFGSPPDLYGVFT